MFVPRFKDQGFSSLTNFVENRTEQSKDFAREYRAAALDAVDFVSQTLRNHPEQKRDASDVMDDLRNSLHAVREETLRGRDQNLASARQAITDSQSTGTLVTPLRSRPLAAPTTETFPTLQNLGTNKGFLNYPDKDLTVRCSTLKYGQESASLDSGEGNYETTKDVLRNGNLTLPAADKATPLVQTVLAHPAFGREEAIEVDDRINSSDSSSSLTASRGLFHRTTSTDSAQQSTATEVKTVTGVPMMEEALGQLQILRDLISAMRPMPSSTVAIPVSRPVTQEATVEYRDIPIFGEVKTRPALVSWNTNYNSAPVVQTTDVLQAPDVPAYISLR